MRRLEDGYDVAFVDRGDCLFRWVSRTRAACVQVV